MEEAVDTTVVSIILTIYNGAKWIDQCFTSIVRQTVAMQRHRANICLEICVYDDASTDRTAELLDDWQTKLNAFCTNVILRVRRNDGLRPRGVGYGRNRAIEIANGEYYCFQDVDDEMLPTRIERQYELASANRNALVGSRFRRIPDNSTCRFTRWANRLQPHQLEVQIYTANGPTIIMPTWFCHRSVYDRVLGGFSEAGYGTPEDFIFFYEHLERGGRILRSNEYLVHYRYHAEATTFSITESTIWHLRMEHLLIHVLSQPPWSHGFTIWNAGKQGRHFFHDLPEAVKKLVHAFCDVDQNKISKVYEHYDPICRRVTHRIPICHFTEAQLPLLICMKLDLTSGAFEKNLSSLNLQEGRDYVLFS